jgi:hypothetical protein
MSEHDEGRRSDGIDVSATGAGHHGHHPIQARCASQVPA